MTSETDSNVGDDRKDYHKWGGMPPAGANEITDNKGFTLKVLLTLGIAIGIWTIYRAVGGEVFTGLHTNSSMFSDFIAKPLFTVLPILICWRIIFKEKGAPVKFARKNMMSGIISALVLVSTFIFLLYSMNLIFFRLFGVREAGFSLIPGWRYMGTWEFILLWLMFVASTGFAEEYEARGFLQDQLGRAMPIWQSIVITGIIFAIGHIPIFIFIRHLSFWQCFYYFIYLIPMSFFMSVYYHWSRNLPAVMIYHGLFDWMLSALIVTAEYQPSYLTSPHVQWGIFVLASFVALGLNFILLYVFYRMFWKKDRPEGSLGFRVPGISETKILRRIRVRSDDVAFSWTATIFALLVSTIVFSGLVMGFGAAFGTMDPSVRMDRIVGMGEIEMPVMADLEQQLGIVPSETDYAQENQVMVIVIYIEEMNIGNITFTLSWRDEPDADGRHENQPDTFHLTVRSPDGSVEENAMGSNGHGDGGFIQIPITMLDVNDPPQELPYLNGTGAWEVAIEVSAGDHEPLVPDPLGIRTFTDRGNDFTLDVMYDYYVERV